MNHTFVQNSILTNNSYSKGIYGTFKPESMEFIECQDTKQCNANETIGLNQEKREFLLEVNSMLQKFQDFVSVLISHPNDLQGENIQFPTITKICTTVCKKSSNSREEMEDSLCLKISATYHGFNG